MGTVKCSTCGETWFTGSATSAAAHVHGGMGAIIGTELPGTCPDPDFFTLVPVDFSPIVEPGSPASIGNLEIIGIAEDREVHEVRNNDGKITALIPSTSTCRIHMRFPGGRPFSVVVDSRAYEEIVVPSLYSPT